MTHSSFIPRQKSTYSPPRHLKLPVLVSLFVGNKSVYLISRTFPSSSIVLSRFLCLLTSYSSGFPALFILVIVIVMPFENISLKGCLRERDLFIRCHYY